MSTSVLTAICLALSAPAMAGNALAGADLSRHIAGPKITVDDAKGKVVLLEYWGYN